MRFAWIGLLGVALLGGCLEERMSQTASIVAFAQAWCEKDLDGALAYVASPFHWGPDGPLAKDEVRRRFAQVLTDEQARLEHDCPSRYDFDRKESLTASEMEERFHVDLDTLVKGYEPLASDRFVLVPPHPNANRDDPLQGFWRPEDDRWRYVAATFD